MDPVSHESERLQQLAFHGRPALVQRHGDACGPVERLEHPEEDGLP